MKKIVFVLALACLLVPQPVWAFIGETLDINLRGFSNSTIVDVLICDQGGGRKEIVTSDKTCNWVKDDIAVNGYNHLELNKDRFGGCRIRLNGDCLEKWPVFRYDQRYDLPAEYRLFIDDLAQNKTFVSEKIERRSVNEWIDVGQTDDGLTIEQSSTKPTSHDFWYNLIGQIMIGVFKIIVMLILIGYLPWSIGHSYEEIKINAERRTNIKIQAVMAIIISSLVYIFFSFSLLPLVLPVKIYFWGCLLMVAIFDWLTFYLFGWPVRDVNKIVLMLNIIVVIGLLLPYRWITQLAFWR